MESKAEEMAEYRDDGTREIIAASIEVHRVLGPGLLESTYEECLCHELTSRNIDFQRQKPLPVVYKGNQLNCGYRLELKTVDTLLPIHSAQLLTYLRLAGVKTGLLINYNNIMLKDGIKRLDL